MRKHLAPMDHAQIINLRVRRYRAVPTGFGRQAVEEDKPDVSTAHVLGSYN